MLARFAMYVASSCAVALLLATFGTEIHASDPETRLAGEEKTAFRLDWDEIAWETKDGDLDRAPSEFTLLTTPESNTAWTDTAGGSSDSSRAGHSFSLSYQAWEFDELTFEVVELLSDTHLGEVEVEDVDRDVAVARYRFGNRSGGIHFDFLLEELEFSSVDFDLLGAGLGFDGQPKLSDLKIDGLSLFLDYSVDFSYHSGDGDAPIINLATGQVVAVLDADVAYFEFTPRVGLGAEYNGIQATIGGIGSFLKGIYEFDTFDVDGDIDGQNAAVLFGLGYRDDELPIAVQLDFLLGDIDGFTLSVGLHF